MAFDLEIAKEIPDGGDWRANSPLGISCAAALANDLAQPIIWHGRTPACGHAAQMNQEEVKAMVLTLQAMVSAGGYTLVTWNGLNFDFPVMAEESGLVSECKELAAHHVDMMFHVFCVKGHYLGLDTAAKGMGLPGKTPGMTGADAPRYWAQERYEEVPEYLAQDVRTTVDVAQACEERGALLWTSQRGNPQGIDLPSGWLPVLEALKLAEAETSWMTNPPKRNDFTAWLGVA